MFNPLMLHIEVDEGVYFNVFSPLWSVAPDGSLVPELAAEVPTMANGRLSEDGLHWRVKLRDDVKWHDGEPFTAEDVKYARPHQQPRLPRRAAGGPRARARYRGGEADRDHLAHGAGLRPTRDPLLDLHGPQAHPLQGCRPQRRALQQRAGWHGPFKWVERVPGDHIVLAANPDFYGEGPHLERLIIKYVPDLTVLFTQFQTGDIDYIGLQGITPTTTRRRRSSPTAWSRRCRNLSSRTSPATSACPSSRSGRSARRSTTAWTSRASSRRSTTACRSRPSPSCRSSPGPTTRTCRSTSTTPIRPGRCWTRRLDAGPGRRAREGRGAARVRQFHDRRQPRP